MNRPGLRTWLLGSRLTAPPMLLGSGYYVWHWWQAGGPDNTGLVAIALMLFSAKAAHKMASYRQWRADWRAMTPGGEAGGWRPRPAMIACIVGLVVVGIGTLWAQSAETPPALRDNLVPLVLACAALGVLLIVRRFIARLGRWCRSRQRRKQPAVTLAIRRPIQRPLSIPACYRRLPPHAKLLLKGDH